jgi:hypothetical protein
MPNDFILYVSPMNESISLQFKRAKLQYVNSTFIVMPNQTLLGMPSFKTRLRHNMDVHSYVNPLKVWNSKVHLSELLAGFC